MQSGQYESLMTTIRPLLGPVSHLPAGERLFELNAGDSVRTWLTECVIIGARLVSGKGGGSLFVRNLSIYLPARCKSSLHPMGISILVNNWLTWFCNSCKILNRKTTTDFLLCSLTIFQFHCFVLYSFFYNYCFVISPPTSQKVPAFFLGTSQKVLKSFFIRLLIVPSGWYPKKLLVPSGW